MFILILNACMDQVAVILDLNKTFDKSTPPISVSTIRNRKHVFKCVGEKMFGEMSKNIRPHAGGCECFIIEDNDVWSGDNYKDNDNHDSLESLTDSGDNSHPILIFALKCTNNHQITSTISDEIQSLDLYPIAFMINGLA